MAHTVPEFIFRQYQIHDQQNDNNNKGQGERNAGVGPIESN